MKRVMQFVVQCVVLSGTLLALGCGQQPAPDTISIKLFPAALASDPLSAPPAGWSSIQYPGGPRARAGVYHVASEPIITGWNILTFRKAAQPDGMAVVAKLNAAGTMKMSRFSGDPANMKKPLAVNVDGRWADVFTMLTEISDGITLYGFTPEEADRLERYLATR